MIQSPLTAKAVFAIGPVTVTEPVVVTWGLMVVLALGGWLVTRSLSLRPSRLQTVVELIVDVIEDQIRGTMRVEPRPYVALVGTLFLFILTANWSSLVPGVEPPTAHLETDAALGLIVFFAIIYFGVRAQGLGGYLKTFAQPTFIMTPLNIVETFTRTFSLIVRLFGNERRVHRRHRAVACRPAGAYSAHGARSADRHRAGLHLYHSRHGVHRQRAE